MEVAGSPTGSARDGSGWATVDGIVDTGAVPLVLPQNLVERLGLETQGPRS